MQKYISRFFVAILAFTIGAGAIYFFAWDNIKTFVPYILSHSAEKNSPYSVLEGTAVRLKPYDATFRIPENWLNPKQNPEPSKNLHLTYDDLNNVYWRNGFDEEDAEVMNSVFFFGNCAAHFGDKGWGNGLWNDLQGRVYVVDLTSEEVSARVEKQGLSKASSVFERASLNSGEYDAWQKKTLEILDAPTHFMLNKDMDFYYRSFGNKTVVFVFLHADRFEKEITLILDSFKWPG
jgi:hypothetical protein